MKPSQSASVSLPVERVEVLLFELASQRFALPVSQVLELSRACAVQRLRNAPDFVLGLLNLRGQLVPVLDLRRRLSFAETALHPDDSFVFARIAERCLALRVDRLLSIEWLTATPSSAPALLSGPLSRLSGVAAVSDGVVLIYDLEQFLSIAEAKLLDQALSAAAQTSEASP